MAPALLVPHLHEPPEEVAGEDKGRQTVGRLEAAEIIVLLVSVDYLAADLYWNEMEQALSRHDAAKARVIPVRVEACDWDLAPFGRLKPLPSDGRPVTSWPNQSEAWADVTRGIRLAVEERADAQHRRHGQAPSARHKITGEAEALGILGNAHASLGDPLLAIHHYDQQMAIACEIGDRETEAASSWNIGIVYEALGNIPRAAGAMRNYVEHLRSIGHTALQQHEAHLNRLRVRATLGRSAR